MSVYDKLNNSQKLPVLTKTPKKFYPINIHKHERGYRIPLEDYQSIFRKLDGTLKKFVGKTPEEFNSHVLNSEHYKLNPSFKHTYYYCNVYQDVLNSTKEFPVNFFSGNNYYFYVDLNNLIQCQYNVKRH